METGFVLRGWQSDGALGLVLPDQHLSDRVDSSTIDLISSIMSYATISL